MIKTSKVAREHKLEKLSPSLRYKIETNMKLKKTPDCGDVVRRECPELQTQKPVINQPKVPLYLPKRAMPNAPFYPQLVQVAPRAAQLPMHPGMVPLNMV